VTADQERRFADPLLSWYSKNKRPLPWRRTRDPYRIWISEILLQQTRVETGLSYYQRFIERFPRLKDLADAPLESVLQVWQGLGYYGRGRNLHRAARTLQDRFDGRIPQDPETLEGLPGIGPYTAAAVASIAFRRDVFTLDGNVKRVLARLYAIRQDPELPVIRRRMEAIGNRLLPRGKAGDFNQAMMELGALVCRPGRPECGRCPVSGTCRAREQGIADRLPIRRPRARIPIRKRVVAAVRNRGRFFLVRRPPEGLLGGLWELPGIDLSSRETEAQGLEKLLFSLNGVLCPKPGSPRNTFSVTHTYSHFQEQVLVFSLTGDRAGTRFNGKRIQPTGQWIRPGDMGEVPITGVTRKILAALESRETTGVAGSPRAKSSSVNKVRRKS
jgi:A/G-specific adenine glycosylase